MSGAHPIGSPTTERRDGGLPSGGVSRSALDAAPPSCPAIWGVLNVTPDSFSDGGVHLDTADAIAHGLAMVRAGAKVIDVGGESSRPKGKDYGDGATEVDVAEELRRVLPVVRALAARVTVSVDTIKPEVAGAVFEAGATILNDIRCGHDPALLEVVARHGAELVLMHNRGRAPAAWGEVAPPNTDYDDVVADVQAELRQALQRAVEAGVARERIWLDPGVGFAKTASQSGEVIRALPALVAGGQRVLLGASRKSFIARLAPNADGSLPSPAEREAGTAVTCALASLHRVHAVRVHDVAAMRQASVLAHSLLSPGGAA